MTTSSPNLSAQISELLQDVVAANANLDPAMAPWHEASKLINSMQIREAALVAAKACGPDIMKNPLQKMILDEINNLAVVNEINGPEVESMWELASHYGYYDMAYNAANEVMFRASSPDDYRLAERYFDTAIAGNGPAELRACAITNSAEIVREGFITGKKDWLGAIALYEKAANMGLLKAMFNAGNVLLWLVESGETSYALRAEAWFKKAIKIIEKGTASLDKGGVKERDSLLMTNRMRLAQMHLHNYLPNSSMKQFEALVAPYKDHPQAQYLVMQGASNKLFKASLTPKGSPVKNWKCFLKFLGWVVEHEEKFDHGIHEGMRVNGTTLALNAGEHGVMLLNVFNEFGPSGSNLERMHHSVALSDSNQLGRPVFFVDTKGLFLSHADQFFSVLRVADKGKIGIVPIWPGASCEDVKGTLHSPMEARLTSNRTDSGNLLPRIINALDEGISLNGEGLPNAIWVGTGSFYCLPIHRAMEPERIGLYVTQTRQELEQAFEGNLR